MGGKAGAARKYNEIQTWSDVQVWREDCAGDRPRLQAGAAGKFTGLLIVTEVAWWIFQKGVIGQKNPKYLGILYCFTSWTQRLTILDARNLSDRSF